MDANLYLKNRVFIMFTNRETNTVASPIHEVCNSLVMN